MSSGQTGEYFFHSENGPAYQNNTLGSSPLQKIKGLNIRSFFTQPTDPPSTKIGLQRNYVLSVYGIGRILLVLAYLGGWIAAAIFVRDNNKAKDSSYQGFVSTQIAYLVFGIAGFVIYFIVFFMEAINFMNAFKFFRRLPLQLIVSVNFLSQFYKPIF